MQYRYSSWLSSGLAARKKGNAGSNPGCEWAISTVPDEFLYVCFDFFLLYFLFCPVIFSIVSSYPWVSSNFHCAYPWRANMAMKLWKDFTYAMNVAGSCHSDLFVLKPPGWYKLFALQIIHDINCLHTRVCGDFLEHVLELLSSCSGDTLDHVKQSILHGGKALDALVPAIINTIVETLVEKSGEVSFYVLIKDYSC